MRSGIIVILYTFLILSGSSRGQGHSRTVLLKLLPHFNRTQLIPGVTSGTTGEIHFNTFRFYISELEFTDDKRVVWKQPNSFHLVDASDTSNLQIILNVPSGIKYDHLRFNLGIDSLTNVSGAIGGALDPTNGMYWTWQSGYINMKLEGNTSSGQKFQFHLGGYQYPFNACRTIALETNMTNEINMIIEVDKFINEIILSEIHTIMSPGASACTLSDKAVKMFSIVP